MMRQRSTTRCFPPAHRVTTVGLLGLSVLLFHSGWAQQTSNQTELPIAPPGAAQTETDAAPGMLLGIAPDGQGLLPGQGGETVVSVNGQRITELELDTAFNEALARGLPATNETRAQVLENLVDRALLLQAAWREKVQDRPEVHRAYADLLIETFVAHRIDQESVEEAEVERILEQADALRGPIDFRVAVIAVSEREDAEQGIHAIASGDALFDTLAETISELPSAERGGDLGWVNFPLPPERGNTGGLPYPLARLLPEMTPNDITREAVEIDGNFYLMKLLDTREAEPFRTAELKRDIRAELSRRNLESAINHFIEEQRDTARIVHGDSHTQ